METFAKWFIVFVMCCHILGKVAMIGKPRKVEPISAGDGILTTVFWGLYITAIVIWWET